MVCVSQMNFIDVHVSFHGLQPVPSTTTLHRVISLYLFTGWSQMILETSCVSLSPTWACLLSPLQSTSYAVNYVTHQRKRQSKMKNMKIKTNRLMTPWSRHPLLLPQFRPQQQASPLHGRHRPLSACHAPQWMQ